MSKRILLLLADTKAEKYLSKYFRKRRDLVWHTNDAAHVAGLIRRYKPEIVFVDLHLPGEKWLEALSIIQKGQPNIRVIITNKYPDVRRELQAKELGVNVFLRQPFNRSWIDKAVQAVEVGGQLPSRKRTILPRVRISMRMKITFPYALLALFFALAAAFLLSRYVLESLRDRFLLQLIDTGSLTADWMVQEESRLLETLRLVSNTEGVADAVVAGDAERLHLLTLPVAVNSQEEAVEILNASGDVLLSLHHKAAGAVGDYETGTGDPQLATQAFIQKVLQGRVDKQGDKFAGMARLPSGDYFYIAGPIFNNEGRLVGAVAVGEPLGRLVQKIRQDTLAHVSIYTMVGNPIISTIFVEESNHLLPVGTVAQILQSQDSQSPVREMAVNKNTYSEILGPWEVRGGQDLGIIGTSLRQNFITRPSTLTRFQIMAVILIGVVGVILLGVYLAHQITNPLSKIVKASIEVAKGNFEVKVPSRGNDEVMVLAHAFNYMVSGLQEGFIYRDLLGRTVSPEVREALRESFALGELRLEGQSTIATVMMSDIRGFTSLSEKEDPTTILKWLNEYYQVVVPVITSFSGVVDKFEGDSVLSFFGILPKLLPSEESAYLACKAALELLRMIDELNIRRVSRGDPPLLTGVGINTGKLIAGGLGTTDRLNYTVIGDAVNTTQRIEGITRSFYESGIVISETTLTALKDRRSEFYFEPLGEHALKGKSELIWLYRLWPENVGRKSQVLFEAEVNEEIES